MSVFESLNKVAYSTQVRSIGCTGSAAKKMLSHETFSDVILTGLLGNNKLNSDWEIQKYEHINSLQISVPVSGLDLELSYRFDMSDPRYKDTISKFITDHDLTKMENPKKEGDAPVMVYPTEEELHDAIIANCDPIDLHRYFIFENIKDYQYWVMATLSNEVANTPEDFDKSKNIRFFIYDPAVARKKELGKANAVANSVQTLLSNKNNVELLRQIALVTKTIDFEEFNQSSDEEVYLALFSAITTDTIVGFTEAVANKSIAKEVLIRKYIHSGLLVIDDEGRIVDAAVRSKLIGNDINSAVAYFNNPLNAGEVEKYANKYKSLK